MFLFYLCGRFSLLSSFFYIAIYPLCYLTLWLSLAMTLIVFYHLGFLSSVSIEKPSHFLYGVVIQAGVYLIFDADMFLMHISLGSVFGLFFFVQVLPVDWEDLH
jgi:hypothetical protein